MGSQKHAILLEIDQNGLFPCSKTAISQVADIETETVESFEKFGTKFLDEELFSPFGAF